MRDDDPEVRAMYALLAALDGIYDVSARERALRWLYERTWDDHARARAAVAIGMALRHVLWADADGRAA